MGTPWGIFVCMSVCPQVYPESVQIKGRLLLSRGLWVIHRQPPLASNLFCLVFPDIKSSIHTKVVLIQYWVGNNQTSHITLKCPHQSYTQPPILIEHICTCVHITVLWYFKTRTHTCTCTHARMHAHTNTHTHWYIADLIIWVVSINAHLWYILKL